jgi:hypothetical protein
VLLFWQYMFSIWVQVSSRIEHSGTSCNFCFKWCIGKGRRSDMNLQQASAVWGLMKLQQLYLKIFLKMHKMGGCELFVTVVKLNISGLGWNEWSCCCFSPSFFWTSQCAPKSLEVQTRDSRKNVLLNYTLFLQEQRRWQSIWELLLHWLPLLNNVPVMVTELLSCVPDG